VSDEHRNASSMCNEYPIRRKPLFMAQIVVPLDLTQQEAARLCAFIMTLAKPNLEYGDLKELLHAGWVMWDGTKWIPCDGTNGTPDLIKRPTSVEMVKHTRADLEEMITDYQEKLRALV
jgi:hypothetical protein